MSTVPPPPPGPPGPPRAPGAPPPVAPASPGHPDDTRPEPGELHLQGRRSWRTWQLLTGLIIAAVIGMAINGAASGSAAPSGSASGSGSSGGSYKLPTESGGSAGSRSSGSTGAAGTGTGTSGRTARGGSTTTTAAGGAGAAGGSTTTTVAGGIGAGAAGGATATTQPLGQEAYLVPAHQASGNWTSPAFNIAGSTWYIGWAFQCNPVPAARPTFAVYVVTPGASPSGTPAVTSSAAQGQSVTNLTTTGSQQLVVQAPSQCQWVVKVTGYGGT